MFLETFFHSSSGSNYYWYNHTLHVPHLLYLITSTPVFSFLFCFLLCEISERRYHHVYFFVNMRPLPHSDIHTWVPFFLELEDIKSISLRAICSFGRATGFPWSWHGAQRARIIRPRCIGAMRSHTKMQSINHSITTAISMQVFFLFCF